MDNEKNNMQQEVFSQDELTKNLQNNLKKIRVILDVDQAQLGDMIGVSRQTINNLENGRVKLNKTHYLAIMAIVDQLIHEDSNLKDTIASLLRVGASKFSVAAPLIGAGAAIGYLSIKAMLSINKKKSDE